ncbi:hypothetical protein LSH36_298g04119 [Paralvinella palmiformis]|uniref:C-type lectin domain-containing protein n=1 Tax=Paralvinella palmiformis TaxID=53620 RepID=A0AAD9N180_9ANNE|nr:hypothetical protein LSH36_298g04119 [Paralvinella palmiformis]
MARMGGWIRSVYVFQIVFAFLIRVQSVTVNKVCKPTRPGQCYTLYNDTAGPLTWIQAQQLCIKYNETMAIVPDPDTQQSLEQLMKIRSYMRVWMAGQSSYMSNNCGYLKVDVAISEILPTSCTDFKNPLCYYLKVREDSCEKDDIHLGSVCLRRLSAAVRWYSALRTCNNIGYNLMRYDPGLLTLNISQLKTGNIWLDVQRYNWEWNTGKVDPFTMSYFNWDRQSGNNIPGYCMYISGKEAKWKSELCQSTTEVSYFVCEKDTTPPGTSYDTNKGVTSEYIIIIAVIAGVACVLTIVLLVLWFRKRQKTPRHNLESPSTGQCATCTMSTIGGNERRCNVYEEEDIGRGTQKKDVQYIYYNNAQECISVPADAEVGGRHKTNDKKRNKSRRSESESDDSSVGPALPSGGRMSWNELCNKYAAAENVANERTLRIGSRNPGTDRDQPRKASIKKDLTGVYNQIGDAGTGGPVLPRRDYSGGRRGSPGADTNGGVPFDLKRRRESARKSSDIGETPGNVVYAKVNKEAKRKPKKDVTTMVENSLYQSQ